MVNCPCCGAPIAKHLEYCPYCDAPLPKEEVIIEQPTQPQVIIQQVVQDDPYAARKEQERQERKYNLKKAGDIYLIIFGAIVSSIAFPFSSNGSDWVFWVMMSGIFIIMTGIMKIKKHKKEYEDKTK